MDKLKLTGQNLGRVFNFRSGRLHAATFLALSVKLPNLRMKTWPKQLLGFLMLIITLPNRETESLFFKPTSFKEKCGSNYKNTCHNITAIIRCYKIVLSNNIYKEML
jgi:hypothetical protein